MTSSTGSSPERLQQRAHFRAAPAILSRLRPPPKQILSMLTFQRLSPGSIGLVPIRTATHLILASLLVAGAGSRVKPGAIPIGTGTNPTMRMEPRHPKTTSSYWLMASGATPEKAGLGEAILSNTMARPLYIRLVDGF